MRNSLLPSLILLALPVSAVAEEVGQGGADVLPGPVSYEVRSWGQLLIRWRIDPDGSGEIWRGPRQRGESALRKFRLRLEGEPLRRFAQNMEQVREAADAGIPCDKEIFDLPYGSVTWNLPERSQVYAFDAGCTSAEAEEAMQTLGAASTIVETMARIDAKPYMVEPMTPR